MGHFPQFKEVKSSLPPGVAQHKIYSYQSFGTLAVLASVMFCLGEGGDISITQLYICQPDLPLVWV